MCDRREWLGDDERAGGIVCVAKLFQRRSDFMTRALCPIHTLDCEILALCPLSHTVAVPPSLNLLLCCVCVCTRSAPISLSHPPATRVLPGRNATRPHIIHRARARID